MKAERRVVAVVWFVVKECIIASFPPLKLRPFIVLLHSNVFSIVASRSQSLHKGELFEANSDAKPIRYIKCFIEA